MKIKSALMTSVGMVLLLAATGATAQLHRCTGSDGRVVYSDRQCAPNEQRQAVKLINNSMDAPSSQGFSSGATGGQGGGGVAVISNNSRSSSSASSSSSSSPPSSRPVRRRCGG